MIQRPSRFIGVVVLATALIAAACSGDDDDAAVEESDGSTSTSETEDAPELTGDPIRIGLVAGITGPGFPLPEMEQGAIAAVESINADGGIDGRPLELEVCDDQQNADEAASCFRSLTEDDSIVAIVGGASLFVDQSTDVIDAAAMPMVGQLGVGLFNFTNELSFPLTGGVFAQFSGLAAVAAQDGAQSVVLARNDLASADTIDGAITGAFEAAGGTVSERVAFPPTQTDFVSIAQQIIDSGPDAVLAPISFAQATPLVQNLRQGGFEGLIVIGGNQLDDGYLDDLGIDPGNLVMTTLLPKATDTSTEYGALFNEDMDGYADGIRNDNTIQSWLAVRAFAQSIADLDEVDRASVLSTLAATSALETGGLTLPIDWSALPGPLPGLTRVPTGQFVVQTATPDGWDWDGTISDLTAGG